MAIILSTHALHPQAEATLAGAGVLRIASGTDADTLLREGSEVDVIIVRAPLPVELFSATSRLRAAIRHGAGLDMIPVEAATAAGVLVANVPGANARTVAEHVFLVTLALLRRFRPMDRDLRKAGWLAGRAHADQGAELGGRTMGIVGMGNVGRAVFRIAGGFGLNVLASTRNPASMPAGALCVDLDRLVAESDVVVLCCPLTPETRGLISRERIARMKPTALLVNVSRGPVVDDVALIAALKDGRIGGAALDVFSTQPLPPGQPYFTFDNVIITPHAAGITEESMMRMGLGATAEAVRVLAGQLPENLCNPEAVERYRMRFPVHS